MMKIVEKPWGREIWIAHTNKYALKIIEIKKGNRSSLQLHRIKHEHLYVDGGTFKVEREDADGRMQTLILQAGEVVEIPPNTRHRAEAVTDIRLIEVSTPELDDVVRLEDDYGRKSGNEKEKR
jgi:mannose-6-phosphate isomerase